MDKQARIGAIKNSLKELDEKSASAHYSMNQSIVKKEWHFVKDAADALIAIEGLKEDLEIEIKSLQEAIEDEAKEELL